jgi:hypothetical protein
VSDAPAPQPGDHLRRILQRLRAKRGDAPPSPYELAFEKGAAGELEFGTALNAAAATRGGCWVLHGLVVEGKRRVGCSALVACGQGGSEPPRSLWAGFTSHSDEYPAQNWPRPPHC